ncbi:MAG: DeoR/GlpR transcriptional regulator [Opitutaceae bacterium]|nr:DeoR/GlpR transcriptional regulator [Opitutaceae bacterium]
MFVQERLGAIEALLQQKHRLTVGELARHFDASEITIRRDLRLLEETGKIVRAHGGALRVDFQKPETEFGHRAVDAVEAKTAIARLAAADLPVRGHVFIDSGTTCLEVGRRVIERSELTIVTNSIPLLALGGEAKARVIGIGGEIRSVSLALVGGLALDWLKAFRFDAAVIGASGLDPEDGAFTTELSEAAVKQMACARSRLRILVAHVEKWNQSAAVLIAPWKRFHRLVTDDRLGRTERARLRLAGVKVQVATIR